MKRNYSIIAVFSIAVIVLASCKNQPQTSSDNYIDKDTLNYEVIADTITYDVVIKNTVKVDPMTDEFLRYLNKTKFIDEIFASIYSGKMAAYDYSTKNKLTLTEIKVMENEEGYSRESIGKIQFVEVWYYNADHFVFKKKVLSMVLGLEVFNEDGTLRGYKPLFKIYSN
jgi:hypothetical protein